MTTSIHRSYEFVQESERAAFYVWRQAQGNDEGDVDDDDDDDDYNLTPLRDMS